MKLVLICIIFVSSLLAQPIKLKVDGKYRLISNIHLVDDIEYKKDAYQALIEIPAGTTAKWEVNHKSGNIEWEFKNNIPRNVRFLGYPGNYGFIPQTILKKADGGDGDPLDIIVLDSAVERGSIQKVKILGALKFLDEGEYDDKIVAVTLTGPFAKINDLDKMMMNFPGAVEIVRYWFEGYDKGSMKFMGYMKQKDAEFLIEKAHKSWSKHNNEY